MSAKNEFGQKVTQALIDSGLVHRLASDDLPDAEQALNDALAVLTVIQARVSAAFLGNQARVGENPLVIAQNADALVHTITMNYDNMLTSELAVLVNGMKEAVESKKATSH